MMLTRHWEIGHSEKDEDLKNVNDIVLFRIRLEFYDNIEEQDALHGVEDVQLHPRCSLQSREDQHDRDHSVRELRVKSEE